MPLGLAREVPNGGFSCAPVSDVLRPPRGFRAAQDVTSAKFEPSGPFFSSGKARGAKAAGLRYEKKVLLLLKEIFPGIRLHQWFKYTNAEQVPRWCQTDAVLLCPDAAIIFEVKIRGTSDAWWQLNLKYRPVVEKATGLPVRGLVQICRAFDPDVQYPCEVRLLNDMSLEAILEAPPGNLLCYSWRL